MLYEILQPFLYQYYQYSSGGSTTFTNDCTGLSSASPIDELRCIIPIVAPFSVASGDKYVLFESLSFGILNERTILYFKGDD